MFQGRIIKTGLVVYHSVQLVRTMSSFIRNEETYPFMKNQNTRFVVFPPSIWLPCTFYKFRSIFSLYSRSGTASKKVFAQKKNAQKLPCPSFTILDRSLVMRLLLSEYRTDQQNLIMPVPVATRTGLRFPSGLPGVKIEFDRKHTHITAAPRRSIYCQPLAWTSVE